MSRAEKDFLFMCIPVYGLFNVFDHYTQQRFQGFGL